MTRPRFFGQLMPKKPVDDILIEKYHTVNTVYDRYPEQLEHVVQIEEDCAVCTNGDKLPIQLSR